MVKNPHAIVEDVVQSLDWEDTLEKEMATHSSILAWRIPWTEEPGGLHSLWGRKRVRQDWSDLTIATISLVSFLSSDFVTMKITVVWPMPFVISYVIWAGLLFGAPFSFSLKLGLRKTTGLHIELCILRNGHHKLWNYWRRSGNPYIRRIWRLNKPHLTYIYYMCIKMLL